MSRGLGTPALGCDGRCWQCLRCGWGWNPAGSWTEQSFISKICSFTGYKWHLILLAGRNTNVFFFFSLCQPFRGRNGSPARQLFMGWAVAPGWWFLRPNPAFAFIFWEAGCKGAELRELDLLGMVLLIPSLRRSTLHPCMAAADSCSHQHFLVPRTLCMVS